MRLHVHLPDQTPDLIFDRADGGSFAVKGEVSYHRIAKCNRQILVLNPMLCGFEQHTGAINVECEKFEYIDHASPPLLSAKHSGEMEAGRGFGKA